MKAQSIANHEAAEQKLCHVCKRRPYLPVVADHWLVCYRHLPLENGNFHIIAVRDSVLEQPGDCPQ